ncbi:TldD/PmbA family protein [Oscillatoria sp. FACHB-1407]|uniref:TldD/PmbA family protein n=1 Tax=Oscillatoria sp. FACHB-1407 TaxID=2692847 RepID=UPI00168552FF|nr:metallopeptidase TldD-related protein [Oscillatoria sp. FACHB-1407]MBD2465641.1 TldD/PmbA family protein [Oscillatoria sp. FACHB-1407]
MNQDLAKLEASFNQLVAALLAELKSDEHLTLSLTGEQSQFVRFNHAKVRQTGIVTDCRVHLTLMSDQRTAYYDFPLTGTWETDWQQARSSLEELRQELPQLPIDPYLVLPTGNANSREVHTGQLLNPADVAATILAPVSELDFTGIYAGGLLLRGYADSLGQKHWFATDSFSLDYSIFTESGQALKGTFAGSHWDAEAYTAKLADAKVQLDRLSQPPKPIAKGQYRTYLAPAAIAEIVAYLCWSTLSEASMQQGNSALRLLQLGEKQLSPMFTLRENFESGLVPRFNELGEVAPLTLPVIESGQLVNTLINSRTAKEYGKIANGANSDEFLRSPEVAPGTLDPTDILKTLNTGLYLSNLHYLNWSDRTTARITGMTRYACFWVENGEIVAPIENLRFDESLYRCFGENLVALTHTQEFVPNVETYGYRSLGGTWVPGMVVDDFTYTL